MTKRPLDQPKDDGYRYTTCEHGGCKDHGFDTGGKGSEIDYEPIPVSFKRSVIKHNACPNCGGKYIERRQKVVRYTCVDCGRVEEEVVSKKVAYCGCCGWHRI
ncbi:hypothetical protein MYX07_05070, partial [Patescibacteria group bacterium AH-259-L07]|nr:hypothetical protein [Patescibacteria group bacterium AH-259-L07]